MRYRSLLDTSSGTHSLLMFDWRKVGEHVKTYLAICINLLQSPSNLRPSQGAGGALRRWLLGTGLAPPTAAETRRCRSRNLFFFG